MRCDKVQKKFPSINEERHVLRFVGEELVVGSFQFSKLRAPPWNLFLTTFDHSQLITRASL